MRFRLLLPLIFVLFAPAANADLLGMKYFLNCKSSYFDLTFEVNKLLKSVTNLDYNQKLKIAYWNDDKINTTFPYTKSFDSIVKGAGKSQMISVNFDRLRGTMTIFGSIAPTSQQIQKCKSKKSWGCDSWFVTESLSAHCTKTKQRF